MKTIQDMRDQALKNFEKKFRAFLKKPSFKRWDAIAHMIVPDTVVTMWQSWIRVDGGAPVRLPTGPDGVTPLPPEQAWTHIPDSFTARRALKAAREGKVKPQQLFGREHRDPPVPR